MRGEGSGGEANPFPRGTDGFPWAGCSRGLSGAFLGARGQPEPLGSPSPSDVLAGEVLQSLLPMEKSKDGKEIRENSIRHYLHKSWYGFITKRKNNHLVKRGLVDLDIQGDGSCKSELISG